MDPDPQLKIGQILLFVLLVDRGHGQLHRHRTGYGPLRIVFVPHWGSEQDEDRIANELVDGAAVLFDDLDHR